jgi:hypothetical protein
MTKMTISQYLEMKMVKMAVVRETERAGKRTKTRVAARRKRRMRTTSRTGESGNIRKNG